jgi:hypothetical protein
LFGYACGKVALVVTGPVACGRSRLKRAYRSDSISDFHARRGQRSSNKKKLALVAAHPPLWCPVLFIPKWTGNYEISLRENAVHSITSNRASSVLICLCLSPAAEPATDLVLSKPVQRTLCLRMRRMTSGGIALLGTVSRTWNGTREATPAIPWIGNTPQPNTQRDRPWGVKR